MLDLGQKLALTFSKLTQSGRQDKVNSLFSVTKRWKHRTPQENSWRREPPWAEMYPGATQRKQSSVLESIFIKTLVGKNKQTKSLYSFCKHSKRILYVLNLSETVGRFFLYWENFQEELIIRRLAHLWREVEGVSTSGMSDIILWDWTEGLGRMQMCKGLAGGLHPGDSDKNKQLFCACTGRGVPHKVGTEGGSFHPHYPLY